MPSSIVCITGIDTGVGKTIVTGLLGRYLHAEGKSVITQKIVQTGCTGLSEDILEHRKIMGQELLPEDKSGLTCPYVFPEPCSPHLAAFINDKIIDCRKIEETTETLSEKYSHILIEGVGGLMVPLNRSTMLIDFLFKNKYPIILVSSSRLGSINHTFSALEIIKQKGLSLRGIVYNRHFATDERIVDDSKSLFLRALKQYGYPEYVIDCYNLNDYQKNRRKINFSTIV